MTNVQLRSKFLAKENLPQKLDTKIFQGPTLQRAALGEIGNIQLSKKDSFQSKHDNKVVPKETSGKACGASKKAEELLPLKKSGNAEKEIEDRKENTKAEVEQAHPSAAAVASKPPQVENIDQNDQSNPQLVSEYVNDIYDYLRKLESLYPVKEKYLEGSLITGKMRTILVDWLIQVHVRFTLLPETLYLTVALIDRYLQLDKSVPRNKLQLVGITAMFIASKYEEMYSPEIGDFVYISDKTYTKLEIRRMEIKMLIALNYNLSHPLPLHFLRRNSKAGQVDPSQHTLAKFLMELCLPEYSLCHIKQSQVAAAALCMSLMLLSDNCEWDATLECYSGYSFKELTPLMSKMAKVVLKAPSSKYQAVRQKYKSSKFMKISEIPQLKSSVIKSLAESP